MTFLHCLKNRNKFHDLLNTGTKDKNLKFSFETERDKIFLFSMLRFVEKKINLQQVFSGKIRSVVFTLILVQLQHLNTYLA